jgi:hypothetical protein
MKKFTNKINESVEDKIPTAEEFFDSSNVGISNTTEYMYCQKDIVKKAIEFAKLHLEAQSEAIIKIKHMKLTCFEDNKESILNAYPLTNIK